MQGWLAAEKGNYPRMRELWGGLHHAEIIMKVSDFAALSDRKY